MVSAQKFLPSSIDSHPLAEHKYSNIWCCCCGCQGYRKRLRELFVRAGYQTSDDQWKLQAEAAVKTEQSNKQQSGEFNSLYECQAVSFSTLHVDIIIIIIIIRSTFVVRLLLNGSKNIRCNNSCVAKEMINNNIKGKEHLLHIKGQFKQIDLELFLKNGTVRYNT